MATSNIRLATFDFKNPKNGHTGSRDLNSSIWPSGLSGDEESRQLAKDSSDVAMIDELTCSTSSTGSSEIVWKEGAPSSPEAARPILLAVGKEDKDLLNMLIPPVDAEICSLQSKGVKVVVSDQEYSLGIEFFR
eukprot:Em0736g1a